MTKEFPNDDFTENDVLACLETAGLKHKRGGRYIFSQCPMPDHQDKNPSAQIYLDDFFVNCNATCGRFHITKAFPNLRRSNSGVHDTRQRKAVNTNLRKGRDVNYKTFDLMQDWLHMKDLSPDTHVHTIPGSILNNLGWRQSGSDIFIPYFSRSRETIPFGQYRHSSGDRRFTFLKDAKPTMYGTFNLEPGGKIFLVEGCSDGAVLEWAMVPWIAAPSASSGALVKAMAGFCMENDIDIIFAGDRDQAGSKLREALDEVNCPYRVRQARAPYKDYGEMVEAEGIMSVQEYCFKELYAGDAVLTAKLLELSKVKEIFPGSVSLQLT